MLHLHTRQQRPHQTHPLRHRLRTRHPLAEGEKSCGTPAPTPSTSRPPDNRCSVDASNATFHGRRRPNDVTNGPSRTLDVRAATAPNVTHTSATTGSPGTTTWSHRKNPSHPAASASTASDTSTDGSPNDGPKPGT